MSVPFVPFVRSGTDPEVFSEYYSDAPIVRIMLDRRSYISKVKESSALWLDVGLDGIANCTDKESSWYSFLNRYGDLTFLRDEKFLKNPSAAALNEPIFRMLDDALRHNPGFISVPQLCQTDGVQHNKVNRILASLARSWRDSQKSKPTFILPVIFTHQKQIALKTDRNPRVKAIVSLLDRSSADGLWVVDSSLDDQSGSGTYEKERFPAHIELMTELRDAVKTKLTVVGPYWGLSVVLWARGLATHLGVGLGSSYRYFTPGGHGNQPKARIAVPLLRRWAVSTQSLKDWLIASSSHFAAGSREEQELIELAGKFPQLVNQDFGKRQIAQFYRDWLSKLNSIQPQGRALALFQEFSSAFVAGRPLDNLPNDEGPARRPERIAQQLMMNCL